MTPGRLIEMFLSAVASVATAGLPATSVYGGIKLHDLLSYILILLLILFKLLVTLIVAKIHFPHSVHFQQVFIVFGRS